MLWASLRPTADWLSRCFSLYVNNIYYKIVNDPTKHHVLSLLTHNINDFCFSDNKPIAMTVCVVKINFINRLTFIQSINQ